MSIVRTLFLLALVILNGCGTFQSKIGSYEAPPQYGHVYSGTQLHTEGWRYYTSFGYKSASVPYKIITPVWHLIVFTIDFPLTLIADSLILPIDLCCKPDYERIDEDTYYERLNASTNELRRLSQEKIEASWEPYRIQKSVGK